MEVRLPDFSTGWRSSHQPSCSSRGEPHTSYELGDYVSFNDAAVSSEFTAVSGGMNSSNELERIWKEAVVL